MTKPISTAQLALSLIDLIKGGAVVFFALLLDFTRQKAAKVEQLAAKEKLDHDIEKSKVTPDPHTDPRDTVADFLNGSGKPS